MLQQNIRSTVEPSAVVVEEYGEEKHIILHDNIHTETEEDGQEMYVYDAVTIQLDKERTETAEDIQEDFDAWWEYGSQPEESVPTLEERVAAIEEFLLEA